ncbi:hypothetical protein WDW89_22755 [Deltaproteobacteria bacterium TL4]
MNTIGIKQAAKALPQLIHDTLCNSEETLIVSEEGTVVMIDQHEWENMQETIKLLRDPISLNALLEGQKARDEGKVQESVSVEEAFHDL